MTDVDALLAGLRSTEKSVEEAAFAALAVCPHPDVTARLIGLLDDRFGYVVKRALEVLAVRADEACIAPLEAFAATDYRLDLVWLARTALATAKGTRPRVRPTGPEQARNYSAESVAEALLWSTRGRPPSDGSVVLVLLPSFDAEAVVTVEPDGAWAYVGFESIWRSLGEGSGWGAGGWRCLLSDDAEQVAVLLDAVEECFAGPGDGVGVDGLRIAAHRLVDGGRQDLGSRSGAGPGSPVIERIRQLGMEAAPSASLFEWFQDLGHYVAAPCELTRTQLPVQVAGLWGSLRDTDVDSLVRAPLDPSPALIDLSRLKFIAPPRREAFVAWLREQRATVLVDPTNPYQPTEGELGPAVATSQSEAVQKLRGAGHDVSLAVIGYWVSNEHPEYPHPSTFVTDEPAEDAEWVADRLDAGLPISYPMGLSPCRLCGQNNGAAELTDGRFVWPEGLSHYVRDHGVRLPAQIVAALGSPPSAAEGGWLTLSAVDPRLSSTDLWLAAVRDHG